MAPALGRRLLAGLLGTRLRDRPGRLPHRMSAGRPRWRATRMARSTATQLISTIRVLSRRRD